MKSINKLVDEVVETYIGKNIDPKLVEARFTPYGFTIIYNDTEIKTIMYSSLEDSK